MPFDVLLLPLLGGYVFITNWNRTRFHTKRYSGERLIFHAALAGVVFLALSYVIVALLVRAEPSSYAWWHQRVPFSYSGTAFGAFLLGALSWIPLNLTTNRQEKEIRRTIEEWNDYLEILLKRAVDEMRQVSVTLKNRKVYVGFVVQSFDPSYDRKYVLLLPTMSGYRRSEEQTLVLTTDYTSVYQQLIAADETRLVEGVDDFQIVLPVSEIQSASLFDPTAYQLFNPTTAS